MSARNNREFLKVLNLLQNDPEIRPLIFEHEALLKALKDMGELKAVQMWSILTAAEKDVRNSKVQTIKTEDAERDNAMIAHKLGFNRYEMLKKGAKKKKEARKKQYRYVWTSFAIMRHTF